MNVDVPVKSLITVIPSALMVTKDSIGVSLWESQNLVEIIKSNHPSNTLSVTETFVCKTYKIILNKNYHLSVLIFD